MTATLKINEELNGVELYFTSKPDKSVLSNLKSNGFRWSSFKNCWWSKQSEKSFQVANSIVGNVKEEVKEIVKKAASKKVEKVMSLWESTQWTELEISQEVKDQDTKLISKEIRAHVKKRFPHVKFSVTSDYNSINVYIKSSPYEEGSTYLKAIEGYCKKLLSAYHHCYDPGDCYTDYPASYNFYDHFSIHWNYEQTEVTEEIKNGMTDFDVKQEEDKKAAEEKRYQDFLVWQKQKELEEIEYKKQQEEEKKQVENIYNSTDIVDLDENNQYFVIGSEFAHLNKNSTLEQYKEEVAKGEYSLENVKITKEIHFNNVEALNNFSNMLLNDFDFLTETGGSFTDDNRINSMTDFHNMSEEERHSVQWNLYGVAVYFEGKLQFVVDAQGYSYVRYVGLTDNAKIEKTITVNQVLSEEEKEELQRQAATLEDISVSVIEELNIMETWRNESWNDYKEAFKNKLSDYGMKLTKGVIQQVEIEELKVSMYKLLSEVDGIQEQFAKADIQQGEKVTLFYISDWGSIVTNRITFDSVTNTRYAQYDNAVKLTFTPQNKRQLHYKHFHSTLLVYKGWHNLPDTVLHHVEENSNGIRTTRSKYHSCDKRQYDEILDYFEQQEIEAIVNTYKPTF